MINNLELYYIKTQKDAEEILLSASKKHNYYIIWCNDESSEQFHISYIYTFEKTRKLDTNVINIPGDSTSVEVFDLEYEIEHFFDDKPIHYSSLIFLKKPVKLEERLDFHSDIDREMAEDKLKNHSKSVDFNNKNTCLYLLRNSTKENCKVISIIYYSKEKLKVQHILIKNSDINGHFIYGSTKYYSVKSLLRTKFAGTNINFKAIIKDEPHHRSRQEPSQTYIQASELFKKNMDLRPETDPTESDSDIEEPPLHTNEFRQIRQIKKRADYFKLTDRRTATKLLTEISKDHKHYYILRNSKLNLQIILSVNIGDKDPQIKHFIILPTGECYRLKGVETLYDTLDDLLGNEFSDLNLHPVTTDMFKEFNIKENPVLLNADTIKNQGRISLFEKPEFVYGVTYEWIDKKLSTISGNKIYYIIWRQDHRSDVYILVSMRPDIEKPREIFYLILKNVSLNGKIFSYRQYFYRNVEDLLYTALEQTNIQPVKSIIENQVKKTTKECAFDARLDFHKDINFVESNNILYNEIIQNMVKVHLAMGTSNGRYLLRPGNDGFPDELIISVIYLSNSNQALFFHHIILTNNSDPQNPLIFSDEANTHNYGSIDEFLKLHHQGVTFYPAIPKEKHALDLPPNSSLVHKALTSNPAFHNTLCDKDAQKILLTEIYHGTGVFLTRYFDDGDDPYGQKRTISVIYPKNGAPTLAHITVIVDNDSSVQYNKYLYNSVEELLDELYYDILFTPVRFKSVLFQLTKLAERLDYHPGIDAVAARKILSASSSLHECYLLHPSNKSDCIEISTYCPLEHGNDAFNNYSVKLDGRYLEYSHDRYSLIDDLLDKAFLMYSLWPVLRKKAEITPTPHNKHSCPPIKELTGNTVTNSGQCFFQSASPAHDFELSGTFDRYHKTIPG